MFSQTRYALNGDFRVAYRTSGEALVERVEVFPDPLGDGGFIAPGHDHLPSWVRVPPWVRAAQYAVRCDGSGSVAHDDRMALPDEEDRLIEAVVVRLLTDRVATGRRSTFRPRIPNFVVLQWSRLIQQCPRCEAPTVRWS